MGLYFFDTSALVKLYVEEPGTDRLLHIATGSSDDRIAILALSAVEARSAIRRRQQTGDIDQSTGSLILDALQKHLESKFLVQAVSATVIDVALEMVDRYPLRAYDALQLAGCIVLGGTNRRILTFVCSDRQLLDAARSEDLLVVDPTV